MEIVRSPTTSWQNLSWRCGDAGVVAEIQCDHQVLKIWKTIYLLERRADILNSLKVQIHTSQNIICYFQK